MHAKTLQTKNSHSFFSGFDLKALLMSNVVSIKIYHFKNLIENVIFQLNFTISKSQCIYLLRILYSQLVESFKKEFVFIYLRQQGPLTLCMIKILTSETNGTKLKEIFLISLRHSRAMFFSQKYIFTSFFSYSLY